MTRMYFTLAAAFAFIACSSSPDIEPDGGPPDLRQLVEDYENGVITRDEFRAGIAAFPDSGTPSLLTDITDTTLLKARAEPYRIAANIEVAPDRFLVVEEGAEIIIGADLNLTVRGRFYAIGSTENPITIRAEAGQRYGAVLLESGPNQIVSGVFDRGQRGVVVAHAFDTTTLIEASRFDSWGDIAIDLVDSSGLTVLGSEFGFQTAAEDVSGETIRAFNSGQIIIDRSTFSFRLGYKDVLDIQNCVGDAWPIIIRNRFDGGEDDAVDLDSCSAFVIGNRISSFTPQNLGQQIGGVNGGGITGDGPSTHPFIANNVIDGCYHGIGFKNGARPVIVNNTIINSNIGVSLYQSAVGNEAPAGTMLNNVLWNNVGWLNGGLPQEIVLNGKWWAGYNQVDDIQATVDARYNITATLAAPYVGEGNLAEDPLIEMVDGIPTLGALSPARDSGIETISGMDIPADIPMDQLLDYLSTDVAGTARAREGDRFPGIDRGAVESSP